MLAAAIATIPSYCAHRQPPIIGQSQRKSVRYPTKASIPNGSTASQEEMIEGQRGVKKYVADMETYLACIVEEEKAARAEIEDLQPEV